MFYWTEYNFNTEFHPIEDPESRNKGIEKAKKKINIGNNIWLGGMLLFLLEWLLEIII